MNSRRDFLKKASLLAGATAAVNFIPASIQRALAIEAAPGSTYLDAEHIVFLMQENRSFDHCFGSLKGVRGFNDPRAFQTQYRLPVWYQKSLTDQLSYPPFHLDIENTQVTWMGDLPHSWSNMVLARNDGAMDRWLEAKRPGNPKYQHIPLTMGYYQRKDIPFYYAFADAFTVCDQHFCSSLTGTSANRSYFWAGSIRENPRDGNSAAHVDNGQINYRDVSWKTYPERLQEAGIPWKVYQNELSLPVGFEGEEEDWLANFTDNNLEFYKQYHVKFHPAYYDYAKKRVKEIEHELTVSKYASEEAYQKVLNRLAAYKQDVGKYSPENFAKLSKQEQEIHKRAFTTNTLDPDYHKLSEISYDGPQGKEVVQVPKGDIFHQFRKDVKEGNLPTVSWLVAPCRFSDHPSSPWYGAWYVSETLDILTSNPEVWKKTIFVLTYDENDGYFDHVSPYVPTLNNRPESGKMAKGIDAQDEYITQEQERARTKNPNASIDSPIGLGYRVPLVIASPWSKGGWVNSEVFDHSSTLQFMEHFLEKKTGKIVKESNISDWRRLVCGNLTSTFRPVPDLGKPNLDFVDRNQYVERIHTSRIKDLPGNFEGVNGAEVQSKWSKVSFPNFGLPIQESGTKSSNALPYDVDVNFKRNDRTKQLRMSFFLKGKLPSTKRIGIPFIVVNHTAYGSEESTFNCWNFAARGGEELIYSWDYKDFVHQDYCLLVYGPNGFYREFKGKLSDHFPEVQIEQQGNLKLSVKLGGMKSAFILKDLAYGRKELSLNTGKSITQTLDLNSSQGWYDYALIDTQNPDLQYRFAGRVENGKSSISDPLMGNTVVPIT